MSRARQGLRPPEHVRDRPVLRRKIWDRVHKEDKNWMGIVCGDTGSGKSEFGLRLCELLDPDFNEDRIAFTIKEFTELVQERHPPGSAILFDEVGIALSHATHYDQDQIRVNHILQSWREQNRILVMTAPHIHLIHKPDRGLLHAQMDMQNIDRERYVSTARYRTIQQNTDTGDLYKKYPRLRDRSTGRVKKYKHLDLFKPSPEIVEPYTERKQEFNDQLNQDVLDQVTPEEEEDEKSPQEIIEEIQQEDTLDQYISIHGGNKTRYIDEDLIKLDYGLSVREAKRVKKALARQNDISE